MNKKSTKKQITKEPEKYIVIEDYEHGERLSSKLPITKNNIIDVVNDYMKDGGFDREDGDIKFNIYKYCGTITSSIKTEIVTVLDFDK